MSVEPHSASPVEQERLSVVIAGHVDHGKSTIVGRLLADTGSLPDGKMEQVGALCARTARRFEYAFLLDALKDERAQGITIDAARVFLRTAKRHYIILDAPGHIEFLKNMVTGASRAEAALLVIDAHEGVQENSRRHGYMIAMLGVQQLAVLINKMDLADYDQDTFCGIVREYADFLGQVGVRPSHFIPVAGREGHNVAVRSAAMPWYAGPTVVEVLDAFVPERSPVEQPFRMPVQDVYKFTKHGDHRRIVAGTVDSGAVHVGDEVVFYPSGKRSRVRSIESFNTPRRTEASAGQATGLTLAEEVYVARGELAARAAEPRPEVTARLRVSLFWLGKAPLAKKKDYLLKLGTARAIARVEEIIRVVDASRLSTTDRKHQVARNDVAECVLQLDRPIAFDLAREIAQTSRFVLVDDFEIRGGGIVREALPGKQTRARDTLPLGEYRWEPSGVPPERRAEVYNQRSALLLVTGKCAAERNALARGLEVRLLEDGKVVYSLGVRDLPPGAGAHLESRQENRAEHLRRLAEVAAIMLDAGAILIVTAAELTQEDLEVVKTTVDPKRVEAVWIGDEVTTDLAYDVWLSGREAGPEGVQRLKALLQDNGTVFRP